MKKRIISILAVVVMLFSISAFAVDQTTITVNVSQVVNNKADISVSISGNPGVTYAYIELEFDPVKLAASDLTKLTTLGDEATLSKNNGKIRFVLNSSTSKMGNGVLFTATMSLLAANFTETPLTITQAMLDNSTGATITTVKNSSKIVVPAAASLDTFTFADKAVSYNGAVQKLSVENLPAGADVTYQNNENKNKGIYTVTAVVSKTGFTSVTKTASLTINPANITVTVNPNQKRRVDAEELPLTYQYQGNLHGTQFTGALTREPGDEVGTYLITQGSLALDSNFGIEFVGNTYEIIEREPQSIEIKDIAPKSYGDTSFPLEVVSSAVTRRSLPVLSYQSDNPAVASVDSDGNVTINGAGRVTFTVTESGDGTYNNAVATKTIQINRRVLVASAENTFADYGDPVAPKINYDNFAEGEDQSVLTAPAVATAFSKPAVGTHAINLDGAEADNYVFEYRPASLFVSKKDITLTDIKVFDKKKDNTAAATIRNSSAVLDGLLSGDIVTINVSAANAVFSSTEVGDEIPVTVSNLELTGRDAANYNLTSTTFTTAASIREALTANDIAEDQIDVAPVIKDSSQFTLPLVPDNFSISIESSSNTSIISTSGKISPVKEEGVVVYLSFAVENLNTPGEIAVTEPRAVPVPIGTMVKINASGELYGKLTGGGDYFINEEVTLTATPDDGYIVYCIRDEEGNAYSSSSYSFTASEPKTFVAEFQRSSNAAVPVSQIVANVKSSVYAGAVTMGTKLVLSTLTPGATIYYTKDGTSPNMGSSIFTDEIIIDKNMTIKAVAVKSQHTDSAISSMTYTVKTGKTTLKSNASGIKYMSVKNDKFRPDVAATRYEVVEALSQLFDIQKISNSKTFSDLDPEYKAVVELFLGAGILDGYPDGTFGGNRGITRAEFVKIMAVMLDLTETNGKVKFNDVSGHWSEGYIKAFSDKGYIAGYPGGDFQPDSNISRAEVVTVVNRIANTKKSTFVAKYADLPESHWAFTDVMSIIKT